MRMIFIGPPGIVRTVDGVGSPDEVTNRILALLR
jgi:hypothetical protein